MHKRECLCLQISETVLTIKTAPIGTTHSQLGERGAVSRGIYELIWHASWKAELALNDGLVSAARNGDTKAQNSIIVRYKKKCRTKHGRPLEASIAWSSRYFDITRVRNAAPAKVPADPDIEPPDSPTCTCDHEVCDDCRGGNHDVCANCDLAKPTSAPN